MGQSEKSLRFHVYKDEIMVQTPQNNWFHDAEFLFKMHVGISEDNVFLYDKQCESFLKKVKYLKVK